ncbi:MAG: hypothetical protein KIT81_02485 [Alphaproteobacteria bacterium]|nr:hypothetical protein [Alphaproteobacteria bacterium]
MQGFSDWSGKGGEALASISVTLDKTRRVAIDIRDAPPLMLQPPELERTDSNSPVHAHEGRLYIFYSHYLPIGHSYRRISPGGLADFADTRPVRFLADPTPQIGKWIEATWRGRLGHLFGWYHAEQRADCPGKHLFVPSIGAAVSNDDGWHWRDLGTILAADASQPDCTFENGFLAGGYGDFTVLPDRAGDFLYLYFSSYVREEAAQGICIARYPASARETPVGHVRIWHEGAWRSPLGRLPTPILAVERSWKHPDPVGFWGPAIHFNTALDLYVMLLNRTAGGRSNLRQDGIHVSFNADIGDPEGWSPPIELIRRGGWYPQIVGLGAGEGDTIAGRRARFFMSGLSAWELDFREAGRTPASSAPLDIPGSTFVQLFGRHAGGQSG